MKITEDKFIRFFEEADDKGGGVAVFDEPVTEPATEPVTEPVTEPAVESKPEPAPTVDAKALAQEFGGEIARALETSRAKDKPPLTLEEAEAALNVWKPTKEWETKFENLETRNDALKELRDGFIRHSDTITQHRLHQLQTAMEEKFSPALAVVEQMQAEQRQTRFDTTYPQLAKPGLRPVLQAVGSQLRESGKRFNSEEEIFDAVATEVAKVIKETNSDFKLEKVSGSSPAKTNPNAIPVTTPGSGGGTGKKGASAPTKPRGLAIFDKD